MIQQILHVESSIFGTNGQSSRLSTKLVEALQQRPDIRVRHRELSAETIPHLDAETFAAFGTADENRTETQAQKVALSDSMIAELKEADLLVLGLPMYNFAIPSTVKAWFDHLGRAGVTFRYTENGPEGLLKGKRAVVIATRGGRYPEGTDTQKPYVEHFLSFIGIDDVRWIHVEGLAMGEEHASRALDQAKRQIETLAAEMLSPGAGS
jgi:FMN-dependent NADH-azoreductase